MPRDYSFNVFKSLFFCLLFKNLLCFQCKISQNITCAFPSVSLVSFFYIEPLSLFIARYLLIAYAYFFISYMKSESYIENGTVLSARL